MARSIGEGAGTLLAPARARGALPQVAALAGLGTPLLLGLGFAALVLLPFIAGTLGAPPGYTFGGSLKALGDEGVYLAAVREGSQGSWLWHDTYMVQMPAPILMYPTYIVTGHLGALLGLSTHAAYALVHAVAALALVGAVWSLGAPFLPRRDRPWFVALAVGMSGLYWLDALLALVGREPASLPWMGMPQLGGLTSALMGAHETLGAAGLAAQFAGLLGALRATDAGGRARALLYGAGGTLLLGLTLPMLLPPAVGVALLFSLWWARQAGGGRFPGAGWRTALAQAGVICLPGLLVALYYYWQLSYGDWAASSLRFSGSRPLVESLLMWGVTLPLGWWGWRHAPPSARPLATLLALWCVCAVLGSQLPFWQGFRFSTGLTVMSGALFALGLLRPSIARAWRVRWLAIVGMGAGIHFMLLLCILISGRAVHLYAPVQEEQAARWLAAHTTVRDVVLAPIGFSNALPSVASCRVVFGHVFLTFDDARRERQVRTFYGGGQGVAARLQALRATAATYVVYDAGDAEDGPFDPRGLPGLRAVFAVPGMAIMRVEPAR